MTSPRIERRLAAILAADVAGYSRLMGVDEVGTLSALKEHRRERIDPAIARHNGRIVRTTGDRLLVEFASVVDAVACAVAIQRLARTHGGQVLRRMRCFGACGGRVGAAWLVTAPILNTRVRPRPYGAWRLGRRIATVVTTASSSLAAGLVAPLWVMASSMSSCSYVSLVTSTRTPADSAVLG